MNEELYTKDDKRVLIVGGGGRFRGKSLTMEMMEACLTDVGYMPTTWKLENGSTFIFDEMSSYYNIEPATTEYPLTYSDNTHRIEPSNLIMKLIERI